MVSVPLSGLLFLNMKERIKALRREVSVPLSGLLFLNSYSCIDRIEVYDVSVPLSGLLFLNLPTALNPALNVPPMFPSPYRGYYF